MKKLFVLGLVGLLALTLAGCSKENVAPPVPPKPGWEKITTVGKATLNIPVGQFEADPIEESREEGMKLQLQVLSATNDTDTKLLLMQLDPPIWLSPILRFADFGDECVRDGFVDAYQKNFTNSYLREVGGGKQGVSWKATKVIPINNHPVLYQSGEIMILKSQEKKLHEHYSWINGGKIYVLIAFYDKKEQSKMAPVVQTMIQSLAFP